jgi:hypothetical protein
MDINLMLSKGIKSAPMLEVDNNLNSFDEAIMLLKEM